MTDYKNELEQILNRLMISANNHRGNAFLLNSDHRKALSSLEALLSQHSKKRELEARVDELRGTRLIAEMAARIEGSDATVKLSTLASFTKDRINQLTNREEK
jgi:hypothetical protein